MDDLFTVYEITLKGAEPNREFLQARGDLVRFRRAYTDGTACVCLPEDYLLRHPGPFDLLAFLDGPVRDYLIAQALVEAGHPWPHGEWAHGFEGLDDWATGFLGSLPSERKKAYGEVLRLREVKGHLACPCGSGKKLRDCHFALLHRLHGLLPRTARSRRK